MAAKVGHTRRVRIAAGRRKTVVLHVKRRFRAKLQERRRILIKERVRARGARAQVSFRAKLIHR